MRADAFGSPMPRAVAIRAEQIALRGLGPPTLAGDAAIADLKLFRRRIAMMELKGSDGPVITAALAPSAALRNKLCLGDLALPLLVPIRARTTPPTAKLS